MEKQTLRPQRDSRKQLWRIAKKTDNGSGGWRSYGSGSIYTTKDQAINAIEKIISNYPEHYQSEKTGEQ